MDTQKGIESNYYFKVLTDGDEYKEKIKKLNNITKDDIIKLSKKIYPDTVFLLWNGGGNAKENN